MLNLKKADWEQIATIYNVFSKHKTVVDWKSVQGSPHTVKEVMTALETAKSLTVGKHYQLYINKVLNEFNIAIDKSIKVRL